jgi:succinoglycan biosynthesis protein ExoV
MELFYFNKFKKGNFGDDLNLWIWDYLLPGWRGWDPDVTLFGVGTLLNEENLQKFRGKKILVAGSGVGYSTPFQGHLSDLWDIRSVRGPYSALALKLKPEYALIDPAVMIPTFGRFKKSARNGRPLFIPHVGSVNRHDWGSACEAVGVDFVSPEGIPDNVVNQIVNAPLVLAESMHAAILADAFRVPWIPIAIGQAFNTQKWQDWAQSLDISCEIRPLFDSIKKATLILRRQKEELPSSGQSGLISKSVAASSSMRPKKLRLAVRGYVESFLLERSLRAALKRPSYLSDESMLLRKQKAYQRVLDEISRDYG